MSKEHQKKLNAYFPQRPILYQPGLAVVLRSIPAAIMLGQLVYWHTKGSRADGFIFKTEQDMLRGTALTRTMQVSARKRLLEFGFIEYKRASIPAKMCYRVNFLNIQKLLPSLKKSCGLTYLDPPTLYDDNLQTITKSTLKTTSKNTTEAPPLVGYGDPRRAPNKKVNKRLQGNKSFSSVGDILSKRRYFLSDGDMGDVI